LIHSDHQSVALRPEVIGQDHEDRTTQGQSSLAKINDPSTNERPNEPRIGAAHSIARTT